MRIRGSSQILDGTVSNANLAGNIAASKLVGTDIATVGTITSGTWTGTTIAVANGGSGATTASGARTAYGLVIGTDVQAQDAELAALAGLTSAADKMPFFTGSGTAAVADFTAAGRALVDDADAAAQRTTLGLGSMATQAASAVAITGGTITGLGSPSAASDAATKAYVDSLANGLDPKASVRAATTANIADLAAGAPSTLDGVTLALNDRILVKNQTTASQNGIYTVTTVGTGANGAYTRATDADASAEVTAGMYMFVEEGTNSADIAFVLTTNNPITLGTTGLTFSSFANAGGITAGAGLTKTGSTLDVVSANGGIVVNADNIALTSDGSTLTIGASGVKVANDGITATQLNTSTAGEGISGGGGTAYALDAVREAPGGAVNGTNTAFTAASTPAPVAAFKLFQNGMLLEPAGVDYTLSGTSITAAVAPATGDVLTLCYTK